MTCRQYIGQSMAILSILIFYWFYNLVQYRPISPSAEFSHIFFLHDMMAI